MQNKDNGKDVFEAVDSITNRYRLQPNDYLFINVSSPDAKLSSFFNPWQGTGSSNTTNREFYYYLLDDSMNVDFPITGKINLKGCNVEQAKEKIRSAVSNYLNDFTLIVRLASNSFTILGEVNKQGHITMPRDQITIYDAIAQAGGFTSYAKRKEVKLLRKDDTGRVHMYVLDVTDDNIINSDFYYIYPNDVLYVRPLKVKSLGFGEVLSVSLVTSLITLYLLVLNVTKK
ncbi:MAG: polysaccharide biosynthesis/export family protein [Bacteroidales bacterium]|nr:polysaccharide biosynthesis/export family protein [Bacteroidales bacterium]